MLTADESRHLESEELISAARSGSIARELAAHVAGCPDCRRRIDEWKAIGVATTAWSAAEAEPTIRPVEASSPGDDEDDVRRRVGVRDLALLVATVTTTDVVAYSHPSR